MCRCECGKERVVYAQSLRSGQSRGCGCARPGPLGALASQKAAGKAIFGKGWLISEKKAAEKKAAERKAAEKVIVWELSDLEREAVRRIDKKGK